MSLEEFKIPKNEVEVRDYLVSEIHKSLIGPRSEEEVIDFNPKTEYFTGVIYPKNSELDEDDKEDEQSIVSSEGDPDNETFSKQVIYKQSSFGISCIIKNSTKSLKVKIDYGRYNKVEEEQWQWKRIPFSEVLEIDISNGKHEKELETNENLKIQYTVYDEKDGGKILDIYFVNNYIIPGKPKLTQIVFQPKMKLISLENEFSIIEDSRDQLSGDEFEVKHMKLLLNKKISFGQGHLCGVTWDKNRIKNRTIDEIETTFLPIETVENITYDIFEDNPDFLNMKKIGNCESMEEMKKILVPIVEHYREWISQMEANVVNLKLNSEQIEIFNQRTYEIKNEVIPRIEKSIELISSDQNIFDSFKFANLSIAWQQTMKKWSDNNIKLDQKIKKFEKEIRKNKKLDDDEKKNQIRDFKKKIELEKETEPFDIDEKIGWRLFQISFILLNIESIADENSKNREVVDLLWFPTGGGKTEAYLGLVAFTIGLRRLKGKNSKGEITSDSLGVTVIMRYTLRLLTVQQFQRAALLMCACEKIRIGDASKWGAYPFLVGLWVGGNVTPNRRHKSKNSALDKKYEIRDSHRKISEIEYNNPYILINCPWCGHEISEPDGDVKGRPVQWRLYCGNTKCMFAKKLDIDPDRSLPIVVTDDDVYSRCPSMIIATGDKFARMAWNPLTSSIFGHVDSFCKICGFYRTDLLGQHGTESSHAHTKLKTKPDEKFISKLNNDRLKPPELIIQDELHLISGSFGTIFGLYETAVEFLSTYKDVKTSYAKPKIIASTATTRAASKQIIQVFNKNQTRIFPPQILDFGETFFSKINNSNDGKMYVGILPTNKSGLSVQAKISATIMFNIIKLIRLGVDPRILDPYYTLVSYYNAQKDLGGSAFSFKDSVPQFISVIEKQSNKNQQSNPIVTLSEESEKILNKIVSRFTRLETRELTSRQASGEIPQILREMQQEYYSTEMPIDLLLATNMLSVGVDIPRLGTMLVNGHPKKHSEYIQATGRIGRNNPGLILTLYSFSKYRDISQFENFRSYHSKYYSYVEETNVTPFTLQSRTHGLFGMIVSVLRAIIRDIAKNNDANMFDKSNRLQSEKIEKFMEHLMERIEKIDPTEIEDAKYQIEKLFYIWTFYVERYPDILKFSENPFEDAPSKDEWYLLKNDINSKKQIIPVPTSFRNTEEELNLFYSKEDIVNE